jgi:hypothetical protein
MQRSSTANVTAVACDIAALVKDYREVYGVRVVPPYILYAPAIATFALLEALNDPAVLRQTSKASSAQQSTDRQPSREDVESATEETMRIMLALSLQFPMGRAITRMIVMTAQALQVRLPDPVLRMVQLLAGGLWRTKDRLKISSAYVNVLMTNDLTDVDFQMDEMLRQWEGLEVSDQA